MTIVLFLALLAAALAYGAWLAQRLARAEQSLDQLIRDDAICRESDRAERGLYLDWRI